MLIWTLSDRILNIVPGAGHYGETPEAGARMTMHLEVVTSDLAGNRLEIAIASIRSRQRNTTLSGHYGEGGFVVDSLGFS